MAFITVQDARVDIRQGERIQDAMRTAGYTPDSFLYLLRSVPVPMDMVVPEDAEVTALRVASGG